MRVFEERVPGLLVPERRRIRFSGRYGSEPVQENLFVRAFFEVQQRVLNRIENWAEDFRITVVADRAEFEAEEIGLVVFVRSAQTDPSHLEFVAEPRTFSVGDREKIPIGRLQIVG